MFLSRYLPQVNLYPDSLPLLAQLKNKEILLGLVTSSRRNLIDQIWKQEELAYFSTTISADDIDRFKPYPDPYLKAVQEDRTRADELFGDRKCPGRHPIRLFRRYFLFCNFLDSCGRKTIRSTTSLPKS